MKLNLRERLAEFRASFLNVLRRHPLELLLLLALTVTLIVCLEIDEEPNGPRMLILGWGALLLLIVCFCLGGSAIGWNGVYLAHVARIAPEGKAGVATGGTLFFTFAGAIFLPLAFGFIHNSFGQYFESFYATAALCFVIALWLLVSKSPKN